MAPEDLGKDTYLKPARNGDFDLIVFDRCAPKSEEDLPRGNTFFIGQPPPPYKRTPGDTITNPQIKGWVAKHPVMRRRRDQKGHRRGGAEERHEVDVALKLGDVREALRERHREQEREQDLHPGERHPQLLEKLRQTPALQLRILRRPLRCPLHADDGS